MKYQNSATSENATTPTTTTAPSVIALAPSPTTPTTSRPSPPPPNYDATVFKVPTKRPPKRRMAIDTEYDGRTGASRWESVLGLPIRNLLRRHPILAQVSSGTSRNTWGFASSSTKKNDAGSHLELILGMRKKVFPPSVKFVPVLRTVKEIEVIDLESTNENEKTTPNSAPGGDGKKTKGGKKNAVMKPEATTSTTTADGIATTSV
ncbi:hypothetical protein Fcan01_21169 [Folsomia candida]|uniref:Uncharacterized protein n=1 Tax=Folsomia candida TaxID=158441 RepID=A0A226DGQ9_FOLCA|nr:hypothetical protein Fcan01_21169 [Folsomia candida]